MFKIITKTQIDKDSPMADALPSCSSIEYGLRIISSVSLVTAA